VQKQNQCPVCRIEITVDSLKKQKKEVTKLLKKIKKPAKKATEESKTAAAKQDQNIHYGLNDSCADFNEVEADLNQSRNSEVSDNSLISLDNESNKSHQLLQGKKEDK
jgi:hypothetical protein